MKYENEWPITRSAFKLCSVGVGSCQKQLEPITYLYIEKYIKKLHTSLYT